MTTYTTRDRDRIEHLALVDELRALAEAVQDVAAATRTGPVSGATLEQLQECLSALVERLVERGDLDRWEAPR